MDNNKSYFYISSNNATLITGVGLRFTNFNLYNILKHNFYKYNAFNLKLESFRHENANLGSDLSVLCLHLRGLNWINGYDTSQSYPDSRVVEMISSVQNDVLEQTFGFNFISNANCISFYRPSIPTVQTLDFFLTSPSGQFYETIGGVRPTYIFSITGIDAYKVVNPSKGLRLWVQNILSAKFSLNSSQGISIDPVDSTFLKRRIYSFKNINFRSIIGNEMYNKYNKFALITRRISTNYEGGLLYSSTTLFGLFLSGSSLYFDTSSFSQYAPISTNSSNFTNAIQYHYYQPACIGLCTTNVGTGRTFSDIYVENIFLKPSSDVCDLVINYSPFNSFSLPNFSSNQSPYPFFCIEFEIIPIEN